MSGRLDQGKLLLFSIGILVGVFLIFCVIGVAIFIKVNYYCVQYWNICGCVPELLCDRSGRLHQGKLLLFSI